MESEYTKIVKKAERNAWRELAVAEKQVTALRSAWSDLNSIVTACETLDAAFDLPPADHPHHDGPPVDYGMGNAYADKHG